jgi:hypothetical protein
MQTELYSEKRVDKNIILQWTLQKEEMKACAMEEIRNFKHKIWS